MLLESDPSGATVYVLPYITWLENGGKTLLSNDAFLETHRVKDGTTPVYVELKPYKHVLVAEWNSHRDFVTFTPKAGASKKLSKRKGS